MRFSLLAVAILLAATTDLVSAQPAPPPSALTLAEVIRLAEQVSPVLRARQAQIFAAEGLRREAAAPFASNPELSVEETRRRADDGNATEPQIGISQAFETGGQQAHRREAAAATLAAVQAEIEDARRQARAEATSRFHAVLLAQRRVEIETRALTLFERSALAVERRRAAGEDTRLDANVALIESERARNALALAREQLLETRGELASVLQLPPGELPEVRDSGEMSASQSRSYSLDELLRSVRAVPRLRALAAREAVARAKLSLEQARRSPDLRVGVSVGREGPASARERVTTLGISVPLPLFNRNAAAIGQAATDASQAEIEHRVALREGEAQVRALWARLVSQRERVLRLQRAMVPAALDNQRLAERSRQAGQIGVLDQLVVSRQALDAERELNDALADFDQTRIELQSAAGWPQEGSQP